MSITCQFNGRLVMWFIMFVISLCMTIPVSVMQQIEIWLPVVGYEDFYEVSTLGNIRTKLRITNGPWGAQRIRKVIYLTKRIDKQGYIRVGVTLPGQRQKNALLHRLVAMAHIPNPENKPMVNHKDGIKGNCNMDNLEWVTRIENARHSFDIGLQVNPKGQDHGCAKLTNEQVLEIREKYKPNRVYGSTKLAREYNISPTNVKDIINRKIWTHI